ncbi:MAG: FdhF/YdeP family oxidoreductase [Prolixibacteraceae bacterium]|jgi:molybdopterin-dependent oxidoreductase alpha subunit|nr:FdhF/YdeP family oxidoreductase [Prolixibacteraceae bacterium]
MTTGGGFKAIWYAVKTTYTVGLNNILKASFSKNTCKTCAYGMGGQKGGMRTETNDYPEICKKNFQAQLTDIQNPIPNHIFQNKSINDFNTMSSRNIERLGRLNTPLYKAEGDTHYTSISWKNAFRKANYALKQSDPNRSFFYSSGRSSNEAAFLLQLFARTYGTNNINNSSYYCHQASGEGIKSVLGTGTATVQLKDLNKVDLFFVIGANPASNHPRFMRQLVNCRRRGGQVIVINPIKENGLMKFAIPTDIRSMLGGGSKIASEFVQLKIGGDIALLKGIAKSVIEQKKYDVELIVNHTINSNEYIDDLKNTTWESIIHSSGISKDRIIEIAKIYGNAKNVVFTWAVGITHHLHGVENVESIVNLALLRGMIGKPNSGLLPLRGHSNVQGVGSVGVTPSLSKDTIRNLEKELNIILPKTEGKDTMSCMKLAHNSDIDFALIMGGNLYQSNPNTYFAKEALNNIPFKLFLTTTLNKGHFNGIEKEVLILPVSARDEEFQRTTQASMFNFVRLSDGKITRLNNVKSEVEILRKLTTSLLGNEKIDFSKLKSHNLIRKLIAKTIAGYEKLDSIDSTKEEFQIPNRTYHQPFFSTPNKKAIFRICAIPKLITPENSFRMMTVRSEGQFNSVVYEEKDSYRQQNSRQVLLMNKQDMAAGGLKTNDLVTIQNETGKLEKLKVKEFNISEGNVMTYFPEANILIPTTTDPRSKTPAYKSVLIQISKS